MRNLTEVLYRLKGSKYDWWYELYSGFTVTNCNDKEVTIDVEFGYGS
jgi:hypothetical protein